MRVDLHINQALAPVDEILACAKRADDTGYEAVWVLDHFASLRPDNEGVMLDPHVLLGAIAGVTTNVHLGVLVNNTAVRSPEAIANATASLDHLSNGRAVLGLGAGAAPGTFFAAEHDALGNTLEASLDARHDRLFATLATIRNIWAGKHDANVTFPKPLGEVPVVVGLNSTRLATRAIADGCGINVRADHPRINEILALSTAPTKPFSTTVWIPFAPALRDPSHPRLRQLADLGVTRVMLLTMSRDDVLNA